MAKVTATAAEVALARIYLTITDLEQLGDDGPGYTWDALPKIKEHIAETLERRPVGNSNLGWIFQIAKKEGSL